MGKSILLALVATAALAVPKAAQRFEAVTVKPCGDAAGDRRTGEVLPGSRGGSASPNRIDLGCWTVKDLILSAYVRYANGRDHSLLALGSMPVEGGEDWINFDRFTIKAKAGGAPGQEEMRGPMMQALLEDRFHLKIHRETREVPVYELRVGEGGSSLRPSKVKTASERLFSDYGTIVVEAQATSLNGLAWLLSLRSSGLSRPVIDRTGIVGLFDFELVYSREGSAPRYQAAAPALQPASVSVTVRCGGSDTCLGQANAGYTAAGAPSRRVASSAPSVLAALQQVGLRLEPAMGPREFLLIDRVERPSSN
jgi:uncharacterized protein (TIGR03435 family)